VCILTAKTIEYGGAKIHVFHEIPFTQKRHTWYANLHNHVVGLLSFRHSVNAKCHELNMQFISLLNKLNNITGYGNMVHQHIAKPHNGNGGRVLCHLHFVSNNLWL